MLKVKSAFMSQRSSVASRVWQGGEGHNRWSGCETPVAGCQGCGGAMPNEFLRFSHKKILILAHFFIEKVHAVSAVTMDNVKIFPQLMCNSRGLAKISEWHRAPPPLRAPMQPR